MERSTLEVKHLCHSKLLHLVKDFQLSLTHHPCFHNNITTDVKLLDKVAIALNTPKVKNGYGLEVCQLEFNKLSKNLECLKQAENTLKVQEVNSSNILDIGSSVLSHCRDNFHGKNSKGEFQFTAYFAPKKHGTSSKSTNGK